MMLLLLVSASAYVDRFFLQNNFYSYKPIIFMRSKGEGGRDSVFPSSRCPLICVKDFLASVCVIDLICGLKHYQGKLYFFPRSIVCLLPIC